MSRAETLAGLTGVIAGHALGPSRRYCACPLRTVTTNAHAAHVAAVALAWLEGHGWAEGKPEPPTYEGRKCPRCGGPGDPYCGLCERDGRLA